MVELSEIFFAKIAGWEAIKKARALLTAGQVSESRWNSPLLQGLVREGSISYRAGLLIKDSINLDNLCSCRESRAWGKICAHSVAVGLHHLAAQIHTPLRVQASGGAVPGRTDRGIPGPSRISQWKTASHASDTSAAAELAIILPPQLEEALARGKIMLCFECEVEGRRTPLNALSTTRPVSFSEQDWSILEKSETLAHGSLPATLLLSLEDFIGFLALMKSHGRVTAGKTNEVRIASAPHRISVEASSLPDGTVALKSSIPPGQTPLRGANASWMFDSANYEFAPIELPPPYQKVIEGRMIIEAADIPSFFQNWRELVKSCELQTSLKPEEFRFEAVKPRIQLNLSGGLAQLEARLECYYGEQRVDLATESRGGEWLMDRKSPKTYIPRDKMAEQEALGRLLGIGFSGPDAKGNYAMKGQDSVLRFFAREYPRLEKIWDVRMAERLQKSASENLERIEPQFEVTSSGEQWFDMNISFQTGRGDRFSAADIQKLLRSGQAYARLPGGKTALFDLESLQGLEDMLQETGPTQHERGYRFAKVQAGFVASTLEDHSASGLALPRDWVDPFGLADDPGQRSPILPPPLESLLRPYQKEGVIWLHFLRKHRFGGVLADEMGLGKTAQALAFLASLHGARPATEKDRSPALVICPTSLIFNWAAEAAKFAPQLKVLLLQGADRTDVLGVLHEYDLIITSYGLLRRDAEHYQNISFDLVILDEAQHIKNRQTQNAQLVKKIRANQRLVLTGTPLENSVFDLWSLFDFIMPGYLGSAREFRERYELPITRERSALAQARLARRIRPFWLRRLKREVLADLPSKIEQISFCELSEEQKGVYQQVLAASRNALVNADSSPGQNRIMIFNALLRLRQISCDLRLLNLAGIDPNGTSGKLELFRELLEEVLDGGHRVLVFSQFVRMLKLLAEELSSREIAFCYLDGETRNRGEVVRKFQETEAIPVFLISLKAGGLGLNLTGADTIIHFDPWWNPAVEDQATDRAHRIGQSRVVTSYKLIARGTLEEKILSLQGRKRELLEGVLGAQELGTESLTWEDVQELLAD